MIIIGEKINGSRRAVARAILERDAGFIRHLAKSQADAGCDYLDINAGTDPEREAGDIAWLVTTVQEVCEIPLCLDSTNPGAVRSGLDLVKQTPLINSVSGEKPSIEGILPLALEYETGLILLALDDETGIPNNSDERMKIVDKLVGLAVDGGLADDHLYVDPLVTAISTGTDSALVTLDTIRKIRSAYHGVHITSGLSNISFGMPLRQLINRTFMAMAVQAGLDSVIADPNDGQLLGAILAAEMLMGKDRYCQNFNRAYRDGRIGS